MCARHMLLAMCILVLAGCERENRSFSAAPPEKELKVSLSTIKAGGGKPVSEQSKEGEQFQKNAYHLSEGKRLFGWFNCVGCHANGGGGSGPALMDDKWLYGSDIENIVSTIREGRPNGMPSFRGKIPDQQIWELAAYVRSLSGNVSRDAAPGRNDDLYPHPAENRLPTLPPKDGGTAPP